MLLATIWPVIYMVLFFAIVFTMLALTSSSRISGANCRSIDVLELDQKIQAGEIKQLTLRDNTFVAITWKDDCQYEVFVKNESSREQILKHARELVDNKPRVERVDEGASQPRINPPAFAPAAAVGFFAFMALHLGTIFVMTAQMPFYIVLAVKNDRLDQTRKIIWVVLFAVVSLFAAPVYWYLYIWRKIDPPTAAV